MAMPRRLVCMRHFLSEGNLAKDLVKAGRGSEVPEEFWKTPDRELRLAADAILQVPSTAEFIRREYSTGFNRCFVADHVRAQESIALLFEHLDWPQTEIFVDPMLGERNWGKFNQLDSDLAAKGYAERKRDPFHWNPGEGEPLLVTRIRARILLERVSREYPGKDVFVVCHGELLEALYSEIAHLGTEEFRKWRKSRWGRMDNGQIFEYSSIDPETEEPNTALRWIRSSCPQRDKFGDWRRIPRTRFTAPTLRDMVDQHPRFLDSVAK